MIAFEIPFEKWSSNKERDNCDMSLGIFSHGWSSIDMTLKKTSNTLKLNSTLTDLIDVKYIIIMGKEKENVIGEILLKTMTQVTM